MIGNPGTSWKAVGTGDFTGAGFSDDILWRNTDGTVAIWEMSGGNVTADPVVGNPGTSWHPIPGSGSATALAGSSGAASAGSAAASSSSTTQSGDPAFGFDDVSDPISVHSATVSLAGIMPASRSSGSDALLLPPGSTTQLVDPTTPRG